MPDGGARLPRVVAVDLHGVVLSGGSHDQDAYAARLGLDPATWARVRRVVLDDEAGWSRLERGEWTLAEFAERLAAAVREAGGDCDAGTAAEIWGAPHPFHGSVPRQDLLAELARLRAAGAVVVLVTNNIADWRAVWRAALPADVVFDLEFDSSHVGARKPEPRFWEIVEEAVDAERGEILLVDDRPEMVDGAVEHGWQAMLYTDEDACVAALARLAGRLRAERASLPVPATPPWPAPSREP